MNQVGYVVTITSELKIDNREDRYDWYKKYDNHFSSISLLNSEDDIPDVVSTQDIKPGEDCYVVWAEYSTGNSMGRCDGNYESFAVFKEKKSALALQALPLMASADIRILQQDNKKRL